MAGVRFTAWLSEGERTALRASAHKNGCSENFLVRIAVRALLLDEPIPRYLHGDENEGNDSNGGNAKNENTRAAR